MADYTYHRGGGLCVVKSVLSAGPFLTIYVGGQGPPPPPLAPPLSCHVVTLARSMK